MGSETVARGRLAARGHVPRIVLWQLWLRVGLLLGWAGCAAGFELFAEEQLLPLAFAAGKAAPVNDSADLGSTHVDDYWSKLDEDDGVSGRQAISKHVRVGCFMVRWGEEAAGSMSGPSPPSAFHKLQLGARGGGREGCVASCNGSVQVYYRPPECRCDLTGGGGSSRSGPTLEEAGEIGEACPAAAWEVFREYDYRSSMSPSTYDAARQLLYQIVTVRTPYIVRPGGGGSEPAGGIRHYLRAVDGVSASPRFEFDTQLDRMIFNAVWDFGRSRMVALSFRDWDSNLDLSIVTFNTSSGEPVVTQEHHPIQEQISAEGALLSSGLASADGMGTVDVLFGTYYTVMPAALPGSSQVVHVIVAIDIERRRVLQSVTLPVTLMNLQINALQHVLYGAGADLDGRYAYFELCRASLPGPGDPSAHGRSSTADAVGEAATKVSVDCHPVELGALPPVVNHMYLQSASIDHELNYAWFAYKQAAAGRPQILEYHHDSADYTLWHEDALHPEAAFPSLANPSAGPQLVFSLKAPEILHARFDPSGERLVIAFDAPTLRGSAPLDRDGDGVPDTWHEPPQGDRVPCEWLLDDATAGAIAGALCEWPSAGELVAEVPPMAMLAPGDPVRPRPGVIFAAGRSPSGVTVFSAPSTTAASVEPPQELSVPRAAIAEPELERAAPGAADGAGACEALRLDGSGSSGHGARGAFVWMLVSAEPPLSAERAAALEQAMAVATTTPAADGAVGGLVWPQVLRIPTGALAGRTTYTFSLTVSSFFDPSVSSTASASVWVEAAPETATATACTTTAAWPARRAPPAMAAGQPGGEDGEAGAGAPAPGRGALRPRHRPGRSGATAGDLAVCNASDAEPPLRHL